MPGIYSFGVDMDGYLIIGFFEHEEVKAMVTLLGTRSILIQLFDTPTSDMIWDKEGVVWCKSWKRQHELVFV